MLPERLVPPLCCLALLTACGQPDPAEASSTAEGASTGDAETESASTAAADPSPFTYWRDTKTILDAKCGRCHRPGEIAPFSLETYEQVAAVAPVLPASIESETMPPWPPSDACRPYAHARSLTEAERDTLLTWLDYGAPQGDPDDVPAAEPDDTPPWVADVSVDMPEPYTPMIEPDDNRCFLVPWTEPERTFVTGYDVIPGNREVVHHVLVFNATADFVPDLLAMDEADPGPGYTCFGGAGVPTSLIGSWVPGSQARAAPEGTGLSVEPGSMMVIQMHYNTLSSAPAPDQTRVELQLAAEVQRPAASMFLTNPGWITGSEPMLIPAGEDGVTYSFDLPLSSPLWRARLISLGIDADGPLLIHDAALHMHYLGASAELSVLRGSGSQECLLNIPTWNFDWQGDYRLDQPLRLEPEDTLRIRCTWNNGEDNQPVVDGQIQPPHDVLWGEGTRDEMCLGGMYITAP